MWDNLWGKEGQFWGKNIAIWGRFQLFFPVSAKDKKEALENFAKA